MHWFEQGGKAYSQYRPDYPQELAAYLANIAPCNSMAVDVGCGSGQLTGILGGYFDHVIGLDPAAGQIEHAQRQANVRYECSPAENLPIENAQASLIAAAQAAHWFDLPRFYQEARRIGRPGAVLALISYGVLNLERPLNERFQRFYHDEIGPYWPPERKLVDSGYADINFPFNEITPLPMQITKYWNLDQLLGYISTWSAVRNAIGRGHADVLVVFAEEMAALWGLAQVKRVITWPINMRVGKL